MSNYKKHADALEIASILGLREINLREHLYHELNRLGYFWKSATRTWELYTIPDAPPPYEPMRIHLWANQDRVDALVDEVIEQLASAGIYVVGRSESIPSKPPEDFNSFVVLRFIAKQSED